MTQIKTRISLLGYLILCFLLIFTSEIWADYGMNENTTIYSNVVFQKWNRTVKDKDASIRQISIPFFISYPVSQRFHLFISEANSMSKYDTEEKKHVSKSLNGIGDTQIQLLGSMADGHVLLSCGLNIPTGKKFDEDNIVHTLRQEAYDFEIGKLEEGPGLSLGMVFVKTIAPVTFDAGISYFYKGSYSPKNEEEYNPGNLLNFTLGFDTEIASTMLRSDLSYTHSTPVQRDNKETFRQGDQFDFETELAYQKQRIKLGIIGRGEMKSKNYRLLDGTLKKDELKLDNNQYELLTFCQYRINSYATLFLEAKRRLVSADDRGTGEAKVWGVNTGTYFEFNDKLRLDFVLEVSRGEYTEDGAQLSGISLSTGITKSF